MLSDSFGFQHERLFQCYVPEQTFCLRFGSGTLTVTLDVTIDNLFSVGQEDSVAQGCRGWPDRRLSHVA